MHNEISKYLLLLFFAASCLNKGSQTQLKPNVLINREVVQAYKKDILSSSNFIKENHLDSISKVATSYVYTIYGKEIVKDPNAIDSLKVNQCRIEVTGFSIDSLQNYNLYYTVFINDTIPALAGFETSLGGMLSGITIDAQKKKIMHGILGGTGTVPVIFNNINEVYDSIWNSPEYQKYILTEYDMFHSKFRQVLPQR